MISTSCFSRYREFSDTNPEHLADLTPTWPETHKHLKVHTGEARWTGRKAMKIWKKTLAIKSLSHITKAYIFYLYQNTAEKKKKRTVGWWAVGEVWQWSAAKTDRSAKCTRLISSYLTGREMDGPNFPTKLLFTECGGARGRAGGKGRRRRSKVRKTCQLQVAALYLCH